jgi:hypothetical protein
MGGFPATAPVSSEISRLQASSSAARVPGQPGGSILADGQFSPFAANPFAQNFGINPNIGINPAVLQSLLQLRSAGLL